MPKVTEGFRRFLTSQKEGLPGADLLDTYLQQGGPERLETQVNVSSNGGEPVAGRRNTWTNGECTWFTIRIPKDIRLHLRRMKRDLSGVLKCQGTTDPCHTWIGPSHKLLPRRAAEKTLKPEDRPSGPMLLQFSV